MKKYKVLTNNLNWKSVYNGDVLFKHEEYWSVSRGHGFIASIFKQYEFNDLLRTRPDWFEEVLDVLFTKRDVFDFAGYYRTYCCEVVVTPGDEAMDIIWERYQQEKHNR